MPETCRSHKRTNTAIAIIVALLLLLLGAFAWGAIQTAINQFANAAAPEAQLHDFFSREDEDTWNKEVWVENTGNVPFIARIQAREFMQWLDAADGMEGRNMLNEHLTSVEDSRVPIPFAPLNEGNQDAMDEMESTFAEGNWGSFIDTDTANPWFVIPDTSWTAHGTVWPAATPPDLFGMYWSWGQINGQAGPTRTDLSVSVMTFAQWDAPGPNTRPADTWVLCEDGYFYYSSEVAPTNDTALLMNGVTFGSERLRSRAFYYAIDLKMEVLSLDDVGVWDPARPHLTHPTNQPDLVMSKAGPNGWEVVRDLDTSQ
ncbi:MAG: hypothetical protein FWG78_04200 [Coriobacteriia bacterium]|nr:hypothetical protein [Coriobacteriia bacterium]